jgi:uncharacterized damage-inducible protein DinB
MKKHYRKGAVGALMDEYERAASEYQSLAAGVSAADFTRIADGDTKDEDCRSIQTVTSHVVGAGYGYANYLRKHFSADFTAFPARLLTHEEAAGEIDKMLAYTEQTLDGRWETSDDEISAVKMETRWGGTYDLEQLLEHAIVHVLRHRRQVEKFLLKFESET